MNDRNTATYDRICSIVNRYNPDPIYYSDASPRDLLSFYCSTFSPTLSFFNHVSNNYVALCERIVYCRLLEVWQIYRVLNDTKDRVTKQILVEKLDELNRLRKASQFAQTLAELRIGRFLKTRGDIHMIPTSAEKGRKTVDFSYMNGQGKETIIEATCCSYGYLDNWRANLCKLADTITKKIKRVRSGIALSPFELILDLSIMYNDSLYGKPKDDSFGELLDRAVKNGIAEMFLPFGVICRIQISGFSRSCRCCTCRSSFARIHGTAIDDSNIILSGARKAVSNSIKQKLRKRNGSSQISQGAANILALCIDIPEISMDIFEQYIDEDFIASPLYKNMSGALLYIPCSKYESKETENRGKFKMKPNARISLDGLVKADGFI